MPVYAVTGKLGTGKTKFAVWRAQLAIKRGLRVASNVDLYLDKLAARNPRASYVRLPDKPTAEDLAAAGHGNPDSYDEDQNGVMILDELGTWLNARAFQDKGRAGLIDFLVHSRKLGWDVYLIVQGTGMIDKQVRQDLIEFEARCVRTDKIKIPLIGGWINDLAGVFRQGGHGGRWGYLPRMHMVASRQGEGQNAIVNERWMYQGAWLHQCYDTRQVFRSDYEHGVFTALHPHRFTPEVCPVPPWVAALRRLMPAPKPRPRPALKPKLPHVAEAMHLHPDKRLAAVAATAETSPPSKATRPSRAVRPLRLAA